MGISALKRIAWLFFSAGIALLTFLAWDIWRGLGSITSALRFEVAAVSAILISGAILRGLYRLQPPQPRGPWQVSLAECLSVVLFAGIWMLLWRTYSPSDFMPDGARLGLLATLWLLMSLLAASRCQCREFPLKLYFAAGLLLKSFGYFSWGALLMLSILRLLDGGLISFYALWKELFFEPWFGGDLWDLFARVGLFGWPVGFTICGLVRFKLIDDSTVTS